MYVSCIYLSIIIIRNDEAWKITDTLKKYIVSFFQFFQFKNMKVKSQSTMLDGFHLLVESLKLT